MDIKKQLIVIILLALLLTTNTAKATEIDIENTPAYSVDNQDINPEENYTEIIHKDKTIDSTVENNLNESVLSEETEVLQAETYSNFIDKEEITEDLALANENTYEETIDDNEKAYSEINYDDGVNNKIEAEEETLVFEDIEENIDDTFNSEEEVIDGENISEEKVSSDQTEVENKDSLLDSEEEDLSEEELS